MKQEAELLREQVASRNETEAAYLQELEVTRISLEEQKVQISTMKSSLENH